MPEPGVTASAAGEVLRCGVWNADFGQDETPGQGAPAAGYTSMRVMGLALAGGSGRVLYAGIHSDPSFKDGLVSTGTVYYRPSVPGLPPSTRYGMTGWLAKRRYS
jgi:hypothetical protein